MSGGTLIERHAFWVACAVVTLGALIPLSILTAFDVPPGPDIWLLAGFVLPSSAIGILIYVRGRTAELKRLGITHQQYRSALLTRLLWLLGFIALMFLLSSFRP